MTRRDITGEAGEKEEDLRPRLHDIKVCSKMPGQNARTADFLLHKINDAELNCVKHYINSCPGILSWHFGT